LTLPPCPADHLAAMAAAVLEKCGLAHSRNLRVLDVGSGSGLVAQTLAAAATEYAAVDLARNELERVSCRQSGAKVTARRMEAADIRLLKGRSSTLSC